MGRIRDFPAFAILLLIASTLMLIPAVLAAQMAEWRVARVFLLHGMAFAVLAVILGIATMNRSERRPARYHLATLLLTYILMPVVLAAPMVSIIPGLGWQGGYFEMLSCLTTTGATLFDQPRLLSDPVHLWRSLVGWIGGFMTLVTAFAILAPLNLGGFEIRQTARSGMAARRGSAGDDASQRVLQSARLILPAYVGFTGILGLLLIFAGDRPFVAICHAMAVIATSGISPVGGLAGGQSGRLGEMALFAFLLLAVSHRTMSFRPRRGERPGLSDPEVQLMLIATLAVTTLLFLRSFIGATEIERQDNITAALQAIWGSLFTTLSFLTTTGFESRDWLTMQLWSNLPSPGTILLGLAVMGGGIATTAGGVKLLRLYALYRHGIRELDVLVHPSSVPRYGRGSNLISPGGSQIAFIFLALFIVTLGLVMIALSATGLSFERSLTLAVAGLTTTGPAIRTLGDGLGYAALSESAHMILCFAMIVGRMEALVIFALFNPTFWRR